MSANIIRAQYDDLEQIAARFAAQAEAVQQQQQRIEQQVAVLEGGGWQGQGVEAFSREMRGEVFPAVERLHLALADAQKCDVINLCDDADGGERGSRVV